VKHRSTKVTGVPINIVALDLNILFENWACHFIPISDIYEKLFENIKKSHSYFIPSSKPKFYEIIYITMYLGNSIIQWQEFRIWIKSFESFRESLCCCFSQLTFPNWNIFFISFVASNIIILHVCVCVCICRVKTCVCVCLCVCMFV